MPRPKLPRDEEGSIIRTVPVVNESPDEVKVEVKKNYTVAKVLTSNGNVIRTYDFATHGEDFYDLAKQMQAQHNDSRIELT